MRVEGWASTPHMDHVRDIVPPSAFTRSLRERGLNGPTGIKLLWQHEKHKPLGSIEVLEVRNNGLWMEAEIEEDISWGKDAAAVINSVGGLSFSIGYSIVDADIVVGPDGYEALQLTEVDLKEVSVVTFPCNDRAVMTYAGDTTEKALAIVRRLRKAINGPTSVDDTLQTIREFRKVFA